LNEGDRNTRFFYAVTKNQIARNRLTSISDVNGTKFRGNRDIANEAVRYFGDLFSSGGQPDVSSALRYIQPVVTEETNMALLHEITEEEIKQALFSIGATNAHGPDGFNAAFYQNYWNIVGPAIVSEVQTFFRTGKMLEQWNHTNLCLIPKSDATKE